MVFTFIMMSGCILLEDESSSDPDYTPEHQEKPPQIVAEDHVEAYVKNKFGDAHPYKIYNFGQLYRLKKPEQLELDQLREQRALVPGLKDHYGGKTDSVLRVYDTLIAQKERYIRNQHIKPDYLISHIFTIKQKDGSGTVYEGDFILNDTLGVKDFKVRMAADLQKDDFDWFYYFFQKFPIFNTGDYEKDLNMSNSIYDFYNARLSRLTEDKEEFLLTALRVTRIINKTKKYDKDIIAGFVIMKKLDEKKICENYKHVVFTPAQEIKTTTAAGDSLIGYKVFHKFECTGADAKTETKVVYAELDPYFVPAGFLNVDPPFDSYFEKKDNK